MAARTNLEVLVQSRRYVRHQKLGRTSTELLPVDVSSQNLPNPETWDGLNRADPTCFPCKTQYKRSISSESFDLKSAVQTHVFVSSFFGPLLTKQMYRWMNLCQQNLPLWSSKNVKCGKMHMCRKAEGRKSWQMFCPHLQQISAVSFRAVPADCCRSVPAAEILRSVGAAVKRYRRFSCSGGWRRGQNTCRRCLWDVDRRKLQPPWWFHLPAHYHPGYTHVHRHLKSHTHTHGPTHTLLTSVMSVSPRRIQVITWGNAQPVIESRHLISRQLGVPWIKSNWFQLTHLSTCAGSTSAGGRGGWLFLVIQVEVLNVFKSIVSVHEIEIKQTVAWRRCSTGRRTVCKFQSHGYFVGFCF